MVSLTPPGLIPRDKARARIIVRQSLKLRKTTFSAARAAAAARKAVRVVL